MAIAGNQGGGRQSPNAAWYLALIIILMAGIVVWAALSLRIDHYTDALKREGHLAVLLTVDDGDTPLVTSAILINPRTDNAALIAVPSETGSLLTEVDRVDRLSSLYDVEKFESYVAAVGALLGQPMDFFIRLSVENFEMMVDLAGGIDIFIPNAIDDTVDGTRYLFPPGGVNLDGAKARSYLEYNPPGEVVEERTGREHRVVQALLGAWGDGESRLVSEEVFPYVIRLVDTNLDQKGFQSFLGSLSVLDADRIVFQGVLGNRRNLDGKDVLFPYYDGKLIKETVQRVRETLEREDEFGEELLNVRVEILNGTDVNGLASRTAQIYQSYGFRIASVTNADRSDYERTVVLDRRGNPDATRRVAELIRCEQIHSRIEENRDETVDVTVILGKDFDGRYVK